MELSIQESGDRTKEMAEGFRNGQMAQNISVSGAMGRQVAKEN
jgi:hypothetical protein